ncbi:MAG: SsrA-binding protein SmpB [Parcubacteria group bacterium]|nr:SsrA-binding protein SmpB [Parcubacteria group bacterium]
MAELAANKKAFTDYDLLEKFEAGISLYGFETKSAKLKRAELAGSRVIIRGGEAFLVGAEIPPYQSANTPKEYDSQRTRKLLLGKKEISRLAGKSEERGLTLIPIRLYTKGNLVKLEFGIARGRKKYDKRARIKERETKRHIERTLKKSAASA